MNRILLIPILALIGFKAQATCNLSTPNDILELIKMNHPDILINASKLDVYKASIDVAKQRVNPKLELQGTTGDTAEGKSDKASISIEHVFELGGKRDSRVEVATRIFEASNAIAKNGNERTLIDVVMKLYRLRQVYELIPLHEEVYSSLQTILKAKNGRRNLSPEEQVEKETLELVINDQSLEISELVSEKDNLIRHLSFYTGKNCDVSLKNLPSDVNLDETFSNIDNSNNYSKLHAAKIGVELAKSKLEFERSLGHSDLSIGPIYEYESIDSQKNHAIGVSLTMDLPIFSTNSGGQEKAAKAIVVANRNLKSIKFESRLDLKSWVKKYEKFKKSLKSVTNKKTLDRKHHRIDSLFKRGIISTALVIEAHRQLMEFSKKRFVFELGAVEAMWNIYMLNGSIQNKKLN